MEGSAAPTRIAATTAAGAPVALRGIMKSYGEVRAVRDASLDVAAGEFLSLLGPSGSGKTTILMMIAGFEIPDAGAIIVGERDVTHLDANRREVGMVFQRYALFPHMTVAENVAFPLEMRRLSRRDIAARVEEALALVRLEGYGGRLPAQLSGGQQQRVALARAVVFRPPVLLMDEPLAALDRKLRQAMQLELKRLQQQLGLTVIYVTHDQEEALTMSDRVVVLRDGRIEQVGRPEELYEEPANVFVAGFIGESNFLDGEVAAVEGGACSVRLAVGGTVPAGMPSPLTAGSRVRLAVRPERVQLHAPGGGLDGVVTDRVYAGAAVTFVVRVGAATDVLVRRAADAANAEAVPIGRRVGVAWSARDARAYPAAERDS